MEEANAQGHRFGITEDQRTTEIIQKRQLEEKDRVITQMKKDLEGKDQVILKMKRELERKDDELKMHLRVLENASDRNVANRLALNHIKSIITKTERENN